MIARLIRLDNKRELSSSVLRRLRWNSRVFGALAYGMQEHPADAALGVPPIDDGHHLRWSVDPRRGLPTAGFFVYKRSHKNNSVQPTHRLEFATWNSRRNIHRWDEDLGEPQPLRVQHTAGFETITGLGALLPNEARPLEITLPTSGRAVRLTLVNVPANAEVRATHAKHLVLHQRTTRTESEWVVVCHDPVDQLHLIAPGARMLRLEWIRVPGDLAGWMPLARFPALGQAPLDAASIGSRIGPTDLTDTERNDYLTQMLDALSAGPAGAPLQWSEIGDSAGLEVDAGVLLSKLTLRPRLAWVFGRYFVDRDSAQSDYLVVAAWIRPDLVPLPTKPANSATTAANLPFVLGGPSLDGLIDVLDGHPGLLYFAPCYAVGSGRSWEPPFARMDALEVVANEVRRQLDDQGRALLEVPLRAQWSLHNTLGTPLLAMHQTPLAEVTLTAPGADPTPHVVASSKVVAGARAAIESAVPRLDFLPAEARLDLRTLGLFGHLTGPPTTRTLALPANLYPTALPPIGVLRDVVPPAGAGSPSLNVMLLWGGRSRLFHPGVHGFVVEWIEDVDFPAGTPIQESLRNGTTLPWKALPQVDAIAPHDANIDALESSVSGQTALARLDKDGDSLVGGVKTDLRLAPGAVGRLDAWTLQIGGQSFPVLRHTVGDDAWLFVALTSGAAGTPFAGLTAEGADQALVSGWTLTPPASDGTTITTAIARVSGAPAELTAFVSGSLFTQGAMVYGVLARVPGPPALVLFDVSAAPQEPNEPPRPRPLPAIGAIRFDAPQTVTITGVAISPPTPAHAKRDVWVRVRTVDFLDRLGSPGSATSASWSKTFPPIPAAGPTIERRSPPDAFGRCKLLVRFTPTLADHGCVLYRASDSQLDVVFQLAKKKVSIPPSDPSKPQPVFTGLPSGFVWPAAGPQRPEDVTDPIREFAELPDTLRNFYNLLQIDEGAASGPRRVYENAFERRGRLARPSQPVELFAAANNAPLELEDVVDRAGNKYIYLVRLVDRAEQESGVSGVSLPGQGWNLAAPAAPELLPVLLTEDEMVIRWRPIRDERVARYRVTRTPLWEGGPGPSVTERTPNNLTSPIRYEGDRVALPKFVTDPVPSTVTSVKTVADGVEHVSDGFAMPSEREFLWWCAAGNRALVVATPVLAGDVRDRVPVAHAAGVNDGTSVNPKPLALYRGVLNGAPWQPHSAGHRVRSRLLVAGSFKSLEVDDGTGAFVDQTTAGTWFDTAFLMVPAAFEEGTAVVLETVAAEGTRRTFGRCPAVPSQAPIRLADGVIALTAAVTSRLDAGDQLSGVFRAEAVTQADAIGAPDPRASGATDFIDAVTWYSAGFVRRLRNGVPVVVRWRRLADATERFLGTQGGRPLRFLDGALVVPTWNPAVESLDGVFDRAEVGVSGATVGVSAGARNMVNDLTADPTTGRLVSVLPDGVPIRILLQDTSALAAHFEPLVWHARRLRVDGLFADGVLAPTELFTFEPNVAGELVVGATDRFGKADLASDGSALVAKGLPPEGAKIELEYDGDGVSRTVDPSRLELSVPLTAADVGRRWEMRVEGLCDFPAPVGVVTSRPAVTEVEVVPPTDVPIGITVAQWSAAKVLHVQYTGPSFLTYTLEAVSDSGVHYVIANPATGGVVDCSTATDSTPLPLNLGLSIRLRATYENAPTKTYSAKPIRIDAFEPGDIL